METDWGVTYKGKTKDTLRVMYKKGRTLGRGPHRCELPGSRGCKRRSVKRQRGRISTISWKSQNLLPVSHGKSRAHSFGTTRHRGSQRVLYCVPFRSLTDLGFMVWGSVMREPWQSLHNIFTEDIQERPFQTQPP